jgi:hypothetical protein
MTLLSIAKCSFQPFPGQAALRAGRQQRFPLRGERSGVLKRLGAILQEIMPTVSSPLGSGDATGEIIVIETIGD